MYKPKSPYKYYQGLLSKCQHTEENKKYLRQAFCRYKITQKIPKIVLDDMSITSDQREKLCRFFTNRIVFQQVQLAMLFQNPFPQLFREDQDSSKGIRGVLFNCYGKVDEDVVVEQIQYLCSILRSGKELKKSISGTEVYRHLNNDQKRRLLTFIKIKVAEQDRAFGHLFQSSQQQSSSLNLNSSASSYGNWIPSSFYSDSRQLKQFDKLSNQGKQQLQQNSISFNQQSMFSHKRLSQSLLEKESQQIAEGCSDRDNMEKYLQDISQINQNPQQLEQLMSRIQSDSELTRNQKKQLQEIIQQKFESLFKNKKFANSIEKLQMYMSKNSIQQLPLTQKMDLMFYKKFAEEPKKQSIDQLLMGTFNKMLNPNRFF